ncbi:MAG: septal ring lytic transglycosylase RlpA family protein [Hyphomicrobiaceae bacterium]|jgi:rare lipoprotein A
MASYYWQPQRVASGGWFNPSAMTAAHKTLPFGTKVRVTNVNNGQSAVVTINDRGPFVAGRVIDLSRAAAGAVGMISSGLARVRVEVLGR